jgi:transcriptional regulator with GAF, ATPase, and Fis domain
MSSHLNLEKAVQAGRFRADLLYRINVAPVNRPPFRDRPLDIMSLVHCFAGVMGIPSEM